MTRGVLLSQAREIAILKTQYERGTNKTSELDPTGGNWTPYLVTVGRWMSKTELKDMQATGHVQESISGIPHVANPANPNLYYGRAPVGDYYVEFAVPGGLLTGSTAGGSSILTPGSLVTQRMRNKAVPPYIPNVPVPAINITVHFQK